MPINCKKDCKGQKNCAHQQSEDKALCRFLEPAEATKAHPVSPSDSSGLLNATTIQDLLVGHRLIDHLSVTDPEGYDHGKTIDRINAFTNELKMILCI